MKKQELMKYRLADAMKQCMKDTPVELVVVSRAALLKRTGKTRTFRKERL